MSTLALYACGLIAGVFVLSGASKLLSPESVLAGMRSLNTPFLLQWRLIAYLLAAAELVLGLALVFTQGPAQTVIAALLILMLGVFTFYLLRALASTEEATCNCFGSLTSGKVSKWSVARNATLIVLLLLVALNRTSTSLMATLFTGPWANTAGLFLAWVLTVTVALAVQNFGMRRTLKAEPSLQVASIDTVQTVVPVHMQMGDTIPPFELYTSDLQPRNIVYLGGDYPVLLLFLSSGCGPCQEAAASVSRWEAEVPHLKIQVVSASAPAAFADELPPNAGEALYGGKNLMRLFGSHGTPSAVVLGGRQSPVIASPVVHGVEEIEALVQSVATASRTVS